MSIDDKIKRIGKRNWQTIADLWIDYISIIDFPILAEYDESTIDMILLEKYREVVSIETKSTERDHFVETPGVNVALFSESILLAYKGINSLKSAQCDQLAGYKSWSISNYYQASYFFCKSILALLGIGFFRTSTNKDLLIDVYPDYGNDKKRAAKYFEEKLSKVQIISQFEHHEVWTIFKRLIGITGELDVEREYINKIRNIDPKEFAKQRNKLIYHNG